MKFDDKIVDRANVHYPELFLDTLDKEDENVQKGSLAIFA
jgi:hypothetical protein